LRRPSADLLQHSAQALWHPTIQPAERSQASKISSVPQTLSNPQVQPAASAHATATPRFDAPALIRLWHLTSLDAPTVAVVWSLAFAWAAHVVLPVWIPTLLAVATWAVYVADRLLDARTALRTGDASSLRERHRFHHRHWHWLVSLAIVAAVAAACIVFTLMPAPARERNSLLAAAALVYFTRVHSSHKFPPFGLAGRFPVLQKELLVGLLFTAACVLPALSRTGLSRNLAPLSAAAAGFALLAWLNCHAIDRWETAEPAQRSPVFPQACLLALAGLLLAAILSSAHPRIAALVVTGAVSSLLLGLLDSLQTRLTPLALRAAADLVLLAPIALILR
jgi:hypothetical protein